MSETLEKAILHLEHQRKMCAVDGKLPAILTVDADIADDGNNVVLIYGLEGVNHHICASFMLDSLGATTERAVNESFVRALAKRFDEAKAERWPGDPRTHARQIR